MIYESETVIDIYNYIIILYDFGGYTFNESYLSTTRGVPESGLLTQ